MYTLKINDTLYQLLRQYHLETEKERVSFLFGRRVESNGYTIILVPNQRPWFFNDDCYENQSGAHVGLIQDAHFSVLDEFVKSEFDTLINVHDHWFCNGDASFSTIDDRDDLQQDQFLRKSLMPYYEEQGLAILDITHCALVMDQSGFSARIVDHRAHEPFTPIDRVMVIGRKLQLLRQPTASKKVKAAYHSLFNRQDFLSNQVQQSISNLKVAILGCGGLGSIISEGLVRLGFRNLLLVDDDRLDISNLNRWQGGSTRQLGQHKAEALAKNLEGFYPHGYLDITTFTGGLYDQEAQIAISGCDLIIGAVDNSVARYVLNRLASRYLIPYLDAGVLVETGEVTDFKYRVVSVIPGETGCMECSKIKSIDFNEVHQAMADPVAHRILRNNGYIKDEPEAHAPSVYPLNMAASSALLTEVLNLLCGFRGLATLAADSFQGDKQRADEANFPETPAEGCVNCSLHLGTGDDGGLIMPRGKDDLTTQDPATNVAKLTNEPDLGR